MDRLYVLCLCVEGKEMTFQFIADYPKVSVTC